MSKEKILEHIDRLIEKGDKVVETRKPNPPNAFGLLTLDSASFSGWQTQTIAFLINLLGETHTYVQSFKEIIQLTAAYEGSVRSGQAILNSVREDVSGGFLTDIKMLVSAEIFTDFIEMAKHLLECGYKDPAASLCGAVLEDGLGKIALKNGIKVKSREDISSLNQKCADKHIYNRLVQKEIEVLNEIRNNADHGKFEDYKNENVGDMINKVSDFLAAYLK